MTRSSISRWLRSASVRQAARRVGKVTPWVLAGLVIVLVVRQAVLIDWGEVRSAVTDLPVKVLALAAALALAGHLTYAAYDLVARRAVGHAASAKRSALIGGIGYAMNLNFGALVGGVAVRLNLYRRAGVPLRLGSLVVAGGMTANWCGWCVLLAGALLWADPLPWPTNWPDLAYGWRLVAAGVALAIPALVLLACIYRAGRRLWRQSTARWPNWKHAATWLLLSLLSWSLASTVVWVLLQGAAPWWAVAGAMMLAAIAGVVTHVPAGLGVLEAVVLTALAGLAPQPTLLAALLAYRAVYYVLPLALALLAYAWLEARTKGSLPAEDKRDTHVQEAQQASS